MSNISANFLTELACKIKAGNSLLSQILKALTAEPTTVSASSLNCEGEISSIEASSIVQTIPHPSSVQLVKLCSSSTRDPEVVCISNDDGLTVVSGWEVFDISESGITSTLYLNGVDVTATYKVVPCGIKVKYDYEVVEICIDGKTWTKTYVYDPTSVTPTLVSILWLDENDDPQPAPSPDLINNENCVAATTPSISDAFGDDLSTLLPGNSFTVTKPDCCKIQIVTSIGTFTLREKETFYSTDKYDSAFTIDSVNILEGTCTLDSIHIISNKTK
jgi:hypothetical protein